MGNEKYPGSSRRQRQANRFLEQGYDQEEIGKIGLFAFGLMGLILKVVFGQK